MSLSETYFPLRSNASALLAGAAANAVVRRIKTAALFGDVLLEDGTYNVNVDNVRGSFAHWDPPRPGDSHKWQSAPERGRQRGAQFGVGISRDGSEAPPAALVAGASEIAWRATFMPVKAQLPHAYQWIRFGHVEMPGQADRLARRLREADEQAGAFNHEPAGYVRNKLLDHVSTDTVIAAALGAAVSVDARHAPAISARVGAGQATVLSTPAVVELLIPDVGEISWEEIDQLRSHKGWHELRAVWTEIGEAAGELADNPQEFQALVQRDYDDRLREAALTARGPNGPSKWFGTFVSLIIGSFATLFGVPIAPGLAAGVYGTASGIGVDNIVRGPASNWLAADQQLRDSVSRQLRREDLS